MSFYAPPKSYDSYHGFTLIELLITVAILAIVAVIAVPSLQNFVLNNRIRTQAAALTTSLVFARTEASALASTWLPVPALPAAAAAAPYGKTVGWFSSIRITIP